jgi:uncharacterized protein (DUF608 family)
MKTQIPWRSFKQNSLTQVAMPMGGIGAGCVSLNGFGGLQDFSIRNHPQLSSAPDGHHFTDAAFGILHLPGAKPVTRLLEGPLPLDRVFAQGLRNQGYRQGGHEGLPRFNTCSFSAAYPFGKVRLEDKSVPLQVQIKGWSPFIPLDGKNSGIPCAVLEYGFFNPTRKAVNFEFSYHMTHLASRGGEGDPDCQNDPIEGKGIYFYNRQNPISEKFGSAALLMPGFKPAIKSMWLRGPGWGFDGISALWREVSTGHFKPNAGSLGQRQEGRNGGSLLVKIKLAPGAEKRVPVVIAWHFPNSSLSVGQAKSVAEATKACCPPGEDCAPAWRPYYAGIWKSAREVALYVDKNYESLKSRTTKFQQALHSSSLPPEILDAAASNLGILKSPTVLRQENGNVWAWEGCFTQSGCCSGSCTHVWNYAQALPHLFPALERTLREQELERSMDAQGHVTFRSALPDGPVDHGFHAASDGQLGGILKLYRDWLISGDTAWMKRLYPEAKRSLEFCIRQWDPDEKGALFEPHHNTYDIEFWGPDGMCTSVYLGALSALAVMARAVGRDADAPRYEALAAKSAAFMKKELFNGDYFQQKVMLRGLKDKSLADRLDKAGKNRDEALELLHKEGPRYQYGSGCLSDGVIGAWMAKIYGVETPLDRGLVRKTLKAIYRHNFRKDLFEHANTQRPGYAVGHEPGLLLCSWPRGGKPTLPFVYSDEVWTGIEYQVASHLIEEGLVKEGVNIVKAARQRYDGLVRNPFDEYECGSYYARAMASYALINSLSGFRYSAVEETLHFDPKLKQKTFKCFFSAASGFGSIRLEKNSLIVDLCEGELKLKKLVLGQKEIPCLATAKVGKPLKVKL